MTAWLMLVALLLLFGYGMMTVFLVEPTVHGLAIASTAIALICLYILSKLNYSRRLLSRNAEYFLPELVRLAHSKAVTEFRSAGAFQPEAVQVSRFSCAPLPNVDPSPFPAAIHFTLHTLTTPSLQHHPQHLLARRCHPRSVSSVSGCATHPFLGTHWHHPPSVQVRTTFHPLHAPPWRCPLLSVRLLCRWVPPFTRNPWASSVGPK